MKLLFLSNFFPPLSRGGYEAWCQEVALGLQGMGHEVVVLTSRTSQTVTPADPSWVRRELFLEMAIASLRNVVTFFTQRRAQEEANLALLSRYLDEMQPDYVLIWGMWNLPRSLAALVEARLPERTIYYMGDYWPTLPNQWHNYWQAPPRRWLTGLPKLLLKPLAEWLLAREVRPALALHRVIFPTQFLQSEFASLGIVPAEAAVIYGAINTDGYPFQPQRAHDAAPLRLLYVGRLSAEKGVHTAIEALALLASDEGTGRFQLQIIGRGEPEYEAELRELVRYNQLEKVVTFLGNQPSERLPQLYHEADVFLFTSIWAEPFGRTPVEAMAAGLAVIGAPVGGAAEILVDEENALHFVPGDAADLAEQIGRLAAEPGLRQRLSQQGRSHAVTRFDMSRMTAEIERYLQDGLAVATP